jgi:hypothetical protein
LGLQILFRGLTHEYLEWGGGILEIERPLELASSGRCQHGLFSCHSKWEKMQVGDLITCFRGRGSLRPASYPKFLKLGTNCWLEEERVSDEENEALGLSFTMKNWKKFLRTPTLPRL